MDELLRLKGQAREMLERRKIDKQIREDLAKESKFQLVAKTVKASLPEVIHEWINWEDLDDQISFNTHHVTVRIEVADHWPIHVLFELDSCGGCRWIPYTATPDDGCSESNYQIMIREFDEDTSLDRYAWDLGAALVFAEMSPKDLEELKRLEEDPFTITEKSCLQK